MSNDLGEYMEQADARHQPPVSDVVGLEQRAERRRNDLFRLLVQSVTDYAIFHLDPTGNVLTWNEGAQRIKGYEADEIIGKHFSIFFPPQDVQRGKPEQELKAAALEGRWEEEAWRIRKDGSRFWANVVITALRDEEGELVGFAKVTRDLTERKKAEEERLRLLARERAAQEAALTARREAEIAEASVRARDEFLSIAAHELKTPMTGLRIATQMLLRRLHKGVLTDPAQLGHALETIERQSTKLARLVTQLLETVRLESGNIQLERIWTDVAELVAEVVDHAQAQTSRHQLVVTAPQGVRASIDTLRFEQVIVNLLDNAIKFSPEGGRIDVEVTQPAPEHVRIAVRDRGLGVKPEDRPHIFERFYQASGSNHRSGMGLGLYISREIVDRHGGRILAEYPDDGGTRVVVELPTEPREDVYTPESAFGTR